MGLKITARSIGDVTILSLDGRIVLGEESNYLRDKIKSLVVENQKKIVLNMSDVTFLDSAGNGTLTASHHYARSKGTHLKFCHLGIKFKEVLQITKLLTVYDIYSTEADALKAFGVRSVYCLCPVCGQGCSPTLLDHWAPQTCTNPACCARFEVADSQKQKNSVPVTKLSFQAYAWDFFEIEVSAPYICHIRGPLDLFSATTLKKCWLSIPLPRRVIFDLQSATEISDGGRAALMPLLAGNEDGSKTAVSLEGLKPDQMAAFPDGPPFYRRKKDALKALGDVSDTPRWLVRISEE